MKSASALFLVAFMIDASIGHAASIFDGTWRPDPQKAGPTQKPDRLELSNGQYHCLSCAPPYEVKADGVDHPVVGNQYYDSISITVVDAGKITKTGKKHGNTVLKSIVAVSPDDRTLTEMQTLLGMGDHPLELTSTSARVSAGQRGSHAVSGSWQLIETDLTHHDEDTTYKISGNTLSMSDRMGRSFTAKLDGTDAPYKGDARFTSVSVKLLDARTIEESDKKAGEVVLIDRLSIDPDGKTVHVRFDDTHGKVQHQTGHKLPG